MYLFTFVAKNPSGQVKALAMGNDKQKTKEHCSKLLTDWFNKKKTKDELYMEAYEQSEYDIIQVDSDDCTTEIEKG